MQYKELLVARVYSYKVVLLYIVPFVLMQYLCELALQDGDPFLKYLPSVVASSAVCLARHTMGQVAWVCIMY